MTTESLPYTVLLILAQLMVGSLITLSIFSWLFQLTRGYLLTSAATILALAILSSATILSLNIPESISGFVINNELVNLTEWLVHGTLILAALYLISLWKFGPLKSRLIYALATTAGLMTILK